LGALPGRAEIAGIHPGNKSKRLRGVFCGAC
jgi:hypothetical protein